MNNARSLPIGEQYAAKPTLKTLEKCLEQVHRSCPRSDSWYSGAGFWIGLTDCPATSDVCGGVKTDEKYGIHNPLNPEHQSCLCLQFLYVALR